MNDGFYWYRSSDGSLEIVEVLEGEVYRLGAEGTFTLESMNKTGQFLDLIEPPTSQK